MTSDSTQMPFLPYGKQSITEEDITAVESVLRSPFLTQGPVVPAFEQAVALKVGSKFGVAVNSATSALHIACIALGLGPGDRLGPHRSPLSLRLTAVGTAVRLSTSWISILSLG